MNESKKVDIETYKKAIIEIVIGIEDPEKLKRIYNRIYKQMKRADR